MRILLIENDFSIGRKLKNLLEKNRYTVDVATVPGDAFAMALLLPFISLSLEYLPRSRTNILCPPWRNFVKTA